MREKEVVVLDAVKQFIRTVHPAIARRLLKDGVARVFSRDPFMLQIISPELKIKWD